MKLNDFLSSIEPKLIEWRRDFHKYPEVGFLEYRTTVKILEELTFLGFNVFTGKDVMCSKSRLGLPKEEIFKQVEKNLDAELIKKVKEYSINNGFTGVIGKINTNRPGPHRAFRFDIDALPIKESDNKNHKPNLYNFSSVNKETMHACGHDGHSAIGLGLANFISTYLDNLNGSFTLIFQPAEEGGRGAKAIVEKGWLNDVDLFFSGHIGIHDLEVGTIATSVSGLLASTKIDATFHGESSHAGLKPEAGRNSLLAGATAVTNLYAISRHSEGISRINVGKMEGGEGRNIVSSNCALQIETRGSNQSVNEYMSSNVYTILESAAKMHNVTVDVDIVGATPIIRCNKQLVENLNTTIKYNQYVQRNIQNIDISVSEDAGFMIDRVHESGGQGTYLLFGTSLPFNHHHPQFDFEEEVLIVALNTYIQTIIN